MRLVPALHLRLPRILGFFSTTLLSIAALMQTASGQSPSSRPQPPPPPATDQEQFISYWTTETGWHSELQLRNNVSGGDDLVVTPVLRATDGSETPLSLVTVKPNEVRTVDIGASVMGTAPQLTAAYGSMVLRYHAQANGNLFAMLMVNNIGHSIAYHFDGTGEEQDPHAGSREGIWWLPNDTASDYLILTNQGSGTLQTELSLYDTVGREVKQKITLAARAATRLSVRQLVRASGLAGFYGGIKVYASAHSGSLDSLHILFDENASFSALMKMFDQNPNSSLEERDFAGTKVWTLRAPMLALSNPDPALAFPAGTVLKPQLFVRNTLGKPVDVSLRFNWRGVGTSGKAAGPTLRLSPFETRLVDVATLQATNIIPKEANWTSVILSTNGKPDEVMAVAASYDQTLRYGAQTPFSDQLAFQWEGSLWEYDAQHNSLITAGNGGTKPLQAAFTVYYNQGSQKYELEQTLQPDEQMWIDMGKLIREHVPDKNGNVLPADLTAGTYEFRDLTNKFIGNLFEGKVVYDKTYGHVTYGCGLCCGYNRAAAWYDPLGVPFLNTAGTGVNGFTTCGSLWQNVSYPYLGHWSTLDHSVATVDYYATHSGVGVGSTTSNAFGSLLGNGIRACSVRPFPTSGGVKVGNPAQLLVIGDTTTFATNCPNTKIRILAYQIQDTNGNDLIGDVQTKEQFASKGTNTCNTTIGTSETCSGTPGGIIHDTLTVGCNSVDNGCGYTYTKQQWVWCNGTTNPVIGTVGDLVVHDNAISVGGLYTSLKNKVIKPQ